MTEREPTGDNDYERSMDHAAELYSDVLSDLSDAGHAAAIIQTGGMCLAIEIKLPDGRSVLVTDKDEILPWDREQHLGWSVYLYNALDDSEPIRSVAVDDGSPTALVDALARFSFH